MCVSVFEEIIDFVRSNKIIKISGKVDKTTLTAMIFCSLLKKKLHQNKERNIITESVVSVGLSTFPIIFLIYVYVYVSTHILMTVSQLLVS